MGIHVSPSGLRLWWNCSPVAYATGNHSFVLRAIELSEGRSQAESLPVASATGSEVRTNKRPKADTILRHNYSHVQ